MGKVTWHFDESLKESFGTKVESRSYVSSPTRPPDVGFVKTCLCGIVMYNDVTCFTSYSGDFFPFHLSDVRLWRMTVKSMRKRRQHCQDISFMSDLNDVNFPVTIASCVSLLGSHLNSIGMM
jgi:hypothetical protein